MKQILTAVGLGFLVVLAYFEPLLLWFYVGSGVTLLVVIYIHRLISARRQVSKINFQPRVLAAGRIRRFVRKVNSEKQKFWQLLPSNRLIVCFVAVSLVALLVGAVVFWFASTDRHSEKWAKVKLIGILSLPAILLFIDSFVNVVIFYLIPPVLVVLPLVYMSWKKLPQFTIFSKKVTTFIILIILLLPYLSVLVGFTNTSSMINAQPDNHEKIEYISNYVLDTHVSFWGPWSRYYNLHRVDDNFLKFWLVGVSACGDMAETTITFIGSLNLTTRRVSFPGEDHAFLEVFLDGQWLVVDPGYNNMTLVSQWDRGLARLTDMGGLSFVAAKVDNDTIDLTEYYVTPDRIDIKIIENGNSIENGKVILKHIFRGSPFSLPPFYSDKNGTVTLNLGPMSYSEKAGSAEQVYWVYVNGKNTDTKISSSGSGKSTLVEINLDTNASD